MQAADERFLASGSESGTAPEDRPFRPDVEGLRAVAVALVVLFHSGIPALPGGYVGVDVFFVISGFVITGVLLRERSGSGRNSILAFYGRRCRRIIPAATLVIIVTVGLTYYFLGAGAGARTATDGRWASVFLANFHFAAVGTNYLAAQQPPSPLQNYWSLSVEEQFYVVYPTLFLVVAAVATRVALRIRLTIALVIVIAASLTFSVIDTANNATGAYFSPFTRAWELALGALVAVGTPWLKKMPTHLAIATTWLGLGAILLAAFVFTAQTAYPGSLVAIPVVGAALIIGGGVSAGRRGVEVLLGLTPLRWLGRLSYSLYLWHWPILIIAAEYAGKTSLSVRDNLGWDVVALVASLITYAMVENPIRHARILSRVPWTSVALGVILVAFALGAITLQSNLASGSDVGVDVGRSTTSTASLQKVLSLVAASNDIRKVPADLVPPLAQVIKTPMSNLGIPSFSTGCWPLSSQSKVPACKFGDESGVHTMVLYGDSHAGMWFQALNDIAKKAQWQLIVLTKAGCPAAPVSVQPTGGGGTWVACDQWHTYAINRINQIDPNLLIVSQASGYRTLKGTLFTSAQWGRGLAELLRRVASPKTAKLVIGNIPSSRGSDCLARHTDDVQVCAGPVRSAETPFNKAESLATKAAGGRYVDTTAWFCARACSAIIGNYDVYYLTHHVALGYSRYLESVLSEALDLPGYARR